MAPQMAIPAASAPVLNAASSVLLSDSTVRPATQCHVPTAPPNTNGTPTSRATAFKYLRERFNAGEITTGLLYVNELREEMHELMGNTETPLCQVPFEALNPGKEELAKLQARYR